MGMGGGVRKGFGVGKERRRQDRSATGGGGALQLGRVTLQGYGGVQLLVYNFWCWYVAVGLGDLVLSLCWRALVC